jgi:hypothetical protein
MFSQGQKTVLGERISFFGDVPDPLRLFPKILGFHLKLEIKYLRIMVRL